jgi:hypothetical protein
MIDAGTGIKIVDQRPLILSDDEEMRSTGAAA